ncbi:MAG TPA: phosphodiester glycosidase family protein [Thermoanaerobaculia bacterium]|nr:phosphodiester glycosidase family protein [Thermoanaerobaculia bacterium]
MKHVVTFAALLCLLATAALADWQTVADGVAYQHYNSGGMDVHVARIDLTSPHVRVVTSRESDRGLRVSDFAKRAHAVIAINGDYFDPKMQPVGLALSPCGVWEGTKDTGREGVVAVGGGRAEIYPQKEVLDPPADWMTSAVSGWPMLVKQCHPLSPVELPGSDGFTRSPHPRTAVGVTEDGHTMFFVVADGRRKDAPGLTLARLAAFMRDELNVCSAMNLDGGGSSAMWVNDQIVNKPSDGSERRVADHLAVVLASELLACDEKPATVDEAALADAKKREEAEQRGNAANAPKTNANAGSQSATPQPTATPNGTTPNTTTSSPEKVPPQNDPSAKKLPPQP